MHVLFEDDGDLKAGTVRSATEASFQVDSTSGKRVKVKSAAVLLRFETPRAEELLDVAQAEAAAMDVDFLWQCAPQQEFGFEQLAREYCGREPTAVEAAAILLRLQSAPVYFQRKGRGRFRPAAPEVLRLALAAVERRRVQEEQRQHLVRALVAGQLPEAIAALGADLLTRPDRNSIEYKALEQAAHERQMTPLRLLLACGAIASPYRWHLASFLARAFPRGVDFPAAVPAPVRPAVPLPEAAVAAFSIDDSATTEIDDAFSVRQHSDALIVGIHIAAPALVIGPGDALDAIARARMSTVYAPGLKFTMLPPEWIDAFSLVEGRAVPALSLYLTLDPHTLALRGAHSVAETVRVAANLRHDLLEGQISAERLDTGEIAHALGAELLVLWRLAKSLRAARELARGRPEPKGREEISLVLEGEGESARVHVQARRRDAPLDLIVSELMIHANRHWGEWMDGLGLAGIYRSQSQGRVRMSTVPAPHEGIGVSHYAWCTSPLRRYVDLVNQRQLLAAASGAPAPHRRGDAELFAIVSGFDAAYTSYAEFQETMERYWSLRWLQQEGVQRILVQVARGDIVRVQGLPMTLRLAAAAAYGRGQELELELAGIDLVDLSVESRLLRALPTAAATPADADAGEDASADARSVAEPAAEPAAQAAAQAAAVSAPDPTADADPDLAADAPRGAG
jgi:exoribonuclease-2